MPVMVKFVEVEASQPVLPAIVHVPEPIAIVLTPPLIEDTAELAPVSDTLYAAASNVPRLIVKTDVEEKLAVKLSCRVTDPPGVAMSKRCVHVFPALVIC